MKKRWATEAAQRCKNDSWWRLLHKRWRPKRLETCASERRRSPAKRQNPKGETFEKGEALE
jgi:hypothetical protein